ncbi:MAG: DUF3147 family protein [Bacillota bacterium]|nr:DUF3147 family protein [Bacillota bacterium]
MELALVWPIVLRFVLGGSAVVASTLVARAFGGRIGGVFAAFPAVYLAAILSLCLEYGGDELLTLSMRLSEGAFIGMVADIICAVAASRYIVKNGWKKGLVQALFIWLFAATGIYFTCKLFY